MCNESKYEIGLDEAGRGPCFGRLYVAGVVWPRNLRPIDLIRDSKTLTSKQLEQAYEFIIQNIPSKDRNVCYADVEEINQYGPLHSDMRALHRCLDLFEICPDHILMDGNYFKPKYYRNDSEIKYTTVIKGDSKYYSIAGASILAKWNRDKYILELCRSHPVIDQWYSISSNKGYLTKKHREGLDKFGITNYHRKKYKCCIGKNMNVLPQDNVVKDKVKVKVKVKVKGKANETVL